MRRYTILVRVLLVLLLAACSGGRSEAPMPRETVTADYLVGTGMAAHDPVAPICVGGGATFCGRKVDPGVPGAIADTLWARAAAISGSNGETFILITTTNIGYFLAYKVGQGDGQGIYDMRLRIAAATGVPSTHIVVVSDHSHNGPDTIGIWGGVSPEYLRLTADSVVEAAIAAYDNRRPARLAVAAVNGNAAPLPGVPRLDSSYADPPGLDESQGNPSNEFRLLVADDVVSGDRILSLVNYAPHATVWNGVATDRLTGDWAAWAPQEAEALYGGMGLATIGTVGATDWNKASGEAEARETEARERLRRLLGAATAELAPVRGGTVAVATRFIREPIQQPVLLLNYKPGLPTGDFDVRIDRSTLPPFLVGTVFGTYVSAIRIGEVFISTFPGEPFGELEFALRHQERVQGAQAYFLLGAANDFFGYMVKRQETYQQTFQAGATWLAGCPEQELIFEPANLPHETGCADHWALMVSPTIGSHIVCSLQDAADDLGFATANRDSDCARLTALDGLAPPDESAAVLALSPDQRRASAWRDTAELVAACARTAAAPTVCAALRDGLAQAGD